MSTERKEAIITEAMDLIIESGLSELTMSKVAKRMKFSEPAMYRHFKNKQDLIISMIQRISGCFAEVFEKFDTNEAPEVLLPKYFKTQLEYLFKVRGVTLLFLSESEFSRDETIRIELSKMFQSQTGRVSNYLELAASRGELRKEVNPPAAALVYMGTIQALITQYLLNSQTIPSEEISQSALDLFLKGVVA